MKKLYIDIETYCDINLSKYGVYRYSEDKSFEVLLLAYSIDENEPKIVDLASDEQLPDEIKDALQDDNVEKWAHNASFERVCLSRILFNRNLDMLLPPTNWRCSMVNCAYAGLPLSLDEAAEISKAAEKKSDNGKKLIKLFSTPCAKRAKNNYMTRNLPKFYPEEWALFKEYCLQDVRTETAILKKIEKLQLPDLEWRLYELNERINDRGFLIDPEFIAAAIKQNGDDRDLKYKELQQITGLANPNSSIQLKEWLETSFSVNVDSLNKKKIDEFVEELPEFAKYAVKLRGELAKTSTIKYNVMLSAKCHDNAVRGCFQFYGASRTGRFAGRLVQPQNMPPTPKKNIDEMRNDVITMHSTEFRKKYESIPETLSSLVRTAIIPDNGKLFYKVDYSSIEMVVLAWLAGQKWVLDAYNAKRDLYCETASKMFHVPINELNKEHPLRAKGKIATLACGYGGSVGALINMGAKDGGLKEDELLPIVQNWRNANVKIVRYWWEVDRAVKYVIRNPDTTVTVNNVSFCVVKGLLIITLPSGRQLSYIRPRITRESEVLQVTYEGVNRIHKWGRIESYGPKFVENIVQAVSRDILCNAMLKLEKKGFKIVLHVHDEIVCENEAANNINEMIRIMTDLPEWCKGLSLRADGEITKYYTK